MLRAAFCDTKENPLQVRVDRHRDGPVLVSKKRGFSTTMPLVLCEPICSAGVSPARRQAQSERGP